MNKDIPAPYQHHLGTRYQSILGKKGLQKLTLRGFWIGCFLSFFLAIAAPYGNMLLNAYMSMDFGTPGAIFIFLFLTGVLNLVFKLAGRRKSIALVVALVTGLVWFSPAGPSKNWTRMRSVRSSLSFCFLPLWSISPWYGRAGPWH